MNRWTRMLLALLLTATVAAFPSRTKADDHGNGNGDGNGNGNGNGGGNGNGNGGGNGNGNGNGNGQGGHGHGHRGPTQFSGSYVIVVRGYYATDPAAASGNTATVTPANVTLTARVKDDAGHELEFSAPNLRITDNYHFSGGGTVGGIAMTVDGHVDPPDPGNSSGPGSGNGASRQVVSHGRLECTYTTTEHHSGRVAGTLSSPPPASSTH